MFSLFRRQQSEHTLGIQFLSDGVAVARVRQEGMPALSFLACEAGAQNTMLKDWVQSEKLSGSHVNVVLSPSDYQILLVEPPDVPEQELKEAIRWRLKDLLSIPVDQAVLDVFALPEDGFRGNKKMVYVVAVDRKVVERVCETMAFAGLKLCAIDISELAIRNVVLSLVGEEQIDRGVAVARVGEGVGSVYLYRQGNMYLVRNFRLDYKAGLDDLPEEAIALELQRSVDYYERQMGQAPPSNVFICGDNVIESKIGAILKSSFAAPVNLLFPKAFAEQEQLDEAFLQQCLGALGGALRREAA